MRIFFCKIGQIIVCKCRRTFDDRTGNLRFGIPRQFGDDRPRRARPVLQCFGEDFANPNHGISRQGLKDREPHVPEFASFVVAKAGPDDFSGQLATHAVIGVLCEDRVGLTRGMGIGRRRDRPTHGGVGILNPVFHISKVASRIGHDQPQIKQRRNLGGNVKDSLTLTTPCWRNVKTKLTKG